MQRRSFIQKTSLAMGLAAGGVAGITSPAPSRKIPAATSERPLITTVLNAFSFNRPLLDGNMTLEELFIFAAETGFPGVDLTAYYIPGYPEVPGDDILFGIRRNAFRMGLAITGTGVRNDFTVGTPGELEKEIALVKRWILAASKLGAPYLRVFAGRQVPPGEKRKHIMDQVIRSFRECAGFAANNGIVLAFQNHYDFIRSTGDILSVMQSVESDWFGLMLDIGSVEGPDPYNGIERLIPHAVTWQVKEQVRTETGNSPTDFHRLMDIVKKAGYRGYFPLETLGEGDPREKVRRLYELVTSTLT
jgi:sugar phosphate isomerase/epimerase